MKTFPIPSAPAPSGGEDKPRPAPAQAFAKGGSVQTAHYAKGGPVLGRVREFMKEPSPFRSSTDGMPSASQLPYHEGGGTPMKENNSYPKKGKGEHGRDKVLKTVMPRQ